MANLSKNAEIRVLLNGQQETGLVEWNDIEIVANYENDNIQPSLSIESFNFRLNARKLINKWIADGMINDVGIFEAIPFEIQVFNSQLTKSFKGYLDFTNGYKDFQKDGNLEIGIFKEKGLDNFFEQIEGVSYGYLESIGVVTNGNYTDIDYVVEKKIQILELVMLSLTTYVMIKELKESIVSLADTISKTISAAIPSVGMGVVINVGNILYAVLSIILRLLYIALILIAIVNMGKQLFELFVQPKRKHKMINLRTALSVVCNHLGYQLETIPFFNNIYYLPSNPQIDDVNKFGVISTPKTIAKGIPHQTDYGYICSEMFELAKKLISGRFAIRGNKFILRPKNDPFWNSQSNFVRNNVFLNTIEYNTQDLKASKLISFVTDISDEFTIDNFTGTNVEIRTSQILTKNKDAVLLKGAEQINFNVALGNRKDKLNPLEKALKDVGNVIDNITGVFGGGTKLASKVKNKVGALKVSSNNHAVPKLLYAPGGVLPQNHRQMLNAVKLYDDFLNVDSFVLNNFGGQKTLRNEIILPFGFNDFNDLVDNAFAKINGKNVKINRIAWKIGQDVTTISFEEKEVYTKNLKETKIIA